MLDILLTAAALGHIDKYFDKEVQEEDFCTVPAEVYSSLDGEELKQRWFMVLQEKLKEKYRTSSEVLIVTEMEKFAILKAFKMLHQYSESLPETASFKERLLIAKSSLPPVFFSSETNEEGCRIIPFKKRD